MIKLNTIIFKTQRNLQNLLKSSNFPTIFNYLFCTYDHPNSTFHFKTEDFSLAWRLRHCQRRSQRNPLHPRQRRPLQLAASLLRPHREQNVLFRNARTRRRSGLQSFFLFRPQDSFLVVWA